MHTFRANKKGGFLDSMDNSFLVSVVTIRSAFIFKKNEKIKEAKGISTTSNIIDIKDIGYPLILSILIINFAKGHVSLFTVA